MKTPLVSICCITYNHAPFIRQSLEAMLMQEGVDYEILIHDDCSTDGTTEIVKEYAAKYPDKIFPMYESESLYKKVGLAGIDVPNYERAKGKYIAYCEGDDVWTDPLKLQKQVVFMEEHPDCSVCFTDFENYDYRKVVVYQNATSALLKKEGVCENGCLELSKEDYFRSWVTMPLTMMFRHSMFDIHWRELYKYYRDQHEIYHLLKQGKCYILNFVSGRRNIHEGGVSGSTSTQQNLSDSIMIAKELFDVNHDRCTADFYLGVLKWAMNYCRKWSWKRFQLAFKVFCIHPNLSMFIRDLKR